MGIWHKKSPQKITKTGEMPAARKEAVKVSTSRNHSYCNLYYISSETKKLHCAFYCEGKLTADGESPDVWFSVGQAKGLTVTNAMHRYSEGEWITKNAARLGANGKYSNFK